MLKSLFALSILTGISIGCSDSSPVTGPSPLDSVKVNAVSPSSGSADNITELSIYGSGFEAGATVTVGAVATDVRVISSLLIKAVSPIYPVGAVDVIVTNPGGKSGRLVRGYTYIGLTVTAVSPIRGLPGDVLRISGTGFSASAVLTIGGVDVRLIQPTTTVLTTLAPILPSGAVDVTVTNPDGQSRTLPQGFTFDAVSISATPNYLKAGSPLTVTWQAPAGRSVADWIGLYRVGAADDDTYVWWDYVNGPTRTSITIPAPNQPGNYEFRYFADDGYIDAARSGVITVIPADGAAPAEAWFSTGVPRSPKFPLIRPGRGRGR